VLFLLALDASKKWLNSTVEIKEPNL